MNKYQRSLSWPHNLNRSQYSTWIPRSTIHSKKRSSSRYGDDRALLENKRTEVSIYLDNFFQNSYHLTVLPLSCSSSDLCPILTPKITGNCYYQVFVFPSPRKSWLLNTYWWNGWRQEQLYDSSWIPLWESTECHWTWALPPHPQKNLLWPFQKAPLLTFLKNKLFLSSWALREPIIGDL